MRLRPVEEQDVPTLCSWAQDPAEAHLWRGFVGVPVRRRFEDSLRWRLAHDLQHLVAEREADRSLVGWFSAYGYSAAAESCDFTVYVPPGTGRRAGEGIVGIWMFLDYLFFGLTLPVRRVQAVVYAYNLRSQQVLAKGGFVREGAIRDGHYFGGRYHDLCFMGLVREAWEAYRKRTNIDTFLDRSGAPHT